MKIEFLYQILMANNTSLIDQGIKAIYLYGSQVPIVDRFDDIPTGKEVDIIFFKQGYLKEGGNPLSIELFNKLFTADSNVVCSLNGIWSEVDFHPRKYYFDILGEGIENVNNGTPSCKIISLKKKIFIWGEKIEKIENKQNLNISDKKKLSELMTSYVRREFYDKKSFQNLKSIYKNAIFIISLFDEKVIRLCTREEQIVKIYESTKVPEKIKSLMSSLILSYKKSNHADVCKSFDLITDEANFDKI